MIFNVSYNNEEQKVLEKLREFERELKQKKKKLDQKVKFKKALRALDNNKSKAHKIKGASGLKSLGKGSSKDLSFMYAMVMAIVHQMNTNLKSMGVQAQHIKLLDENNSKFNKALDDLKAEGSSIFDFTDEGSLLTSSDISSKMTILGNYISQNQENEMRDTGAAQSLQTNNASEKGLAQSMLDLDKQIFRQVHFKKG